MESTAIIMIRKAKNVFDSLLDNNIPFYWKVSLLRRRISAGGMKEHMDINNG